MAKMWDEISKESKEELSSLLTSSWESTGVKGFTEESKAARDGRMGAKLRHRKELMSAFVAGRYPREPWGCEAGVLNVMHIRFSHGLKPMQLFGQIVKAIKESNEEDGIMAESYLLKGHKLVRDFKTDTDMSYAHINSLALVPMLLSDDVSLDMCKRLTEVYMVDADVESNTLSIVYTCRNDLDKSLFLGVMSQACPDMVDIQYVNGDVDWRHQMTWDRFDYRESGIGVLPSNVTG